jgi:tetratricopeptide (TPR) repeat protein
MSEIPTGDTQPAVRAWAETVTIPTYRIGIPEKNPMFLEKRVYQGSSGAVYPHPIVERVFDEKEDQQYNAVYLENRYLKIMLLPEIGGRVQMALDKTNNYHFIYYNQVIKPALVGLTGPWISGGIEFNWPQHHRPSTFEPVDYRIDENPDGSWTVWMGEIERMFRTKGTAGFTLYPDRAYLEISVQLYNRTDFPQTFLWWANPAVSVNDDYQSVFPPDVFAVMDHGKRDVSTFPIATGTYYKVDYSPGTDISRYKNIPVPTSYMAYHSDFDFVGCYDHGKQAGMMHVANHHVVPGKKQWTWGNGDFGKAWDRHLTDEDGPYIELMCGAYTDNQPDFSWLQPGEEKRFTQVFMPYKQIGVPKNASKDALLNLEVDDSAAQIAVYLSSRRTVRVVLEAHGKPLFERDMTLDPETTFSERIALDEGTTETDLRLTIYAGDRELLSYAPQIEQEHPIPPAATAARPPSEIESNEELFLNGLHLEQYRHATYEPEPYYEEALRRDPLDSRCNNAMGLLLLRHGKFAEAETYFRLAVTSLTRRNPNPYDGEPYYNLGLSLRLQGRYDEAFDAFYKAVWNAAWQDSGYFELARIACRRGECEEALDLVERSLDRNQRHFKARHLKTLILRCLGRKEEAVAEAETSLTLDRLDFGAMLEQKWLNGDTTYRTFIRNDAQTMIEIALDYAHAGLFSEALDILSEAPATDPMVKYYAGWVALRNGDTTAANAYFSEAQTLSPDYCFPHRIEAVLALEAAIQHNANDPRAPYYLGNFWYAHRRYNEAIACWEQARQLDPNFPTVYRNLGLAYMNKRHDAEAAHQAYEQAFALDPSDGRVLFELDQLDKQLGHDLGARLERLEQHRELVDGRDDLTIERLTLLNLIGRHDEALNVLLNRTFHPWEGGEGKVTAQYVASLVEKARHYLHAEAYDDAIRCLKQALEYPINLGEGKLAGARDNHINYLLGETYAGLGDKEQATAHFEAATQGSFEPASAMYYNDQPPEMILYQGLARRALGRFDEADAIFQSLVDYGREHLNDDVRMDYFAVSLPDFLVFDTDLNQRNQLHCHFMIGLGLLGLGKKTEAQREFDMVLAQQPDHIGALTHRVWEDPSGLASDPVRP